MTSPSRSLRRVVPVAALLLIASIVAPARTGAAVPDCGQSTIPRIIVGNDTGTLLPPPTGYVVVVRDIVGNVVGGAMVTISFRDTPAALIRLLPVQNAGTVVNCASREVSQLANAAGQARFGVRFGGYQSATTIDVILDGIACTDRAIAYSTDIAIAANPAETGLSDLVQFAACYANPGCQCTPAAQQFDYDLNFQGACLGDFVLFAAEYAAGPQGPYCP